MYPCCQEALGNLGDIGSRYQPHGHPHRCKVASKGMAPGRQIMSFHLRQVAWVGACPGTWRKTKCPTNRQAKETKVAEGMVRYLYAPTDLGYNYIETTLCPSHGARPDLVPPNGKEGSSREHVATCNDKPVRPDMPGPRATETKADEPETPSPQGHCVGNVAMGRCGAMPKAVRQQRTQPNTQTPKAAICPVGCALMPQTQGVCERETFPPRPWQNPSRTAQTPWLHAGGETARPGHP